MTAAEIRSYDCGSLGNPSYPRQAKIKAHKPTLSEVVTAVRAKCAEENRRVPRFNIELKSDPKQYDVFVPRPETFVALVLKELKTLDLTNIAILQSFDLNILREIHRQDTSGIPISYLVTNAGDIEAAIGKLGFTPAIYSPHHRLVSRDMISYVAARDIRVIPWTVNSERKMRRLIRCGVDGIITDYPDLIK